MKFLPFSKDLKLPLDVVTQKTAFLGISGGGKTYAATKLVEDVIRAGGQVVVVDTVGNWWGLRLAADGKKPGIAIPILGGDHADVPLEANSGKLTATTAAESRASMILDISDFSEDEQISWACAFSTEFLRAKKAAKSPVLVVWEECQDLVPQMVSGKDAQRTLRAVQRLIKRGRNYGVGTVLISQRSAAVNKEALNQVETLFTFRTVGPQDRGAIADWVAKKNSKAVDLVEELPGLSTGTCFVWSPSWLDVFRKVRVAKKWTFDASATPDFDDNFIAGALSPVDLAKFQKRMGQAIEKAKDSDPSYLRSQVAKLKGEIRQLGTELEHKASSKPPKIIEKMILKPALAKQLDVAVKRFETHAKAVVQSFEKLIAARGPVLDQMGQLTQVIEKALHIGPEFALAKTMTNASTATAAIAWRSKPPPKPTPRMVPRAQTQPFNGERTLGKCERSILTALGWRYPTALEVTQLGVLAGYSASGGGFRNGLSALRTQGYIESLGDLFQLSSTGFAWIRAHQIEQVNDPVGLYALWGRILKPKNAALLKVIIDGGAEGITMEDLADAVGMDAAGGGFRNYVSKLNATSLIMKRGNNLRAVDLFLGG